uniref:C2 domain-containing protein n=1 Tax=Anopheles maculatus TaxID=74869 RepID=A0A182SYD7_9DIPT
CSSTSSCSTKFDPELLRADLAIAKERVFRLKKELSRIQKEMHSTQKGVDTLASVEQKLNAHVNGCYNISEAQAIMEEVKKIQKSLITGEREKKELMKSLAQVKDDLTRLQLRQESPDASTFNLAQDRICAASQTDLSSEHFPMGAREMAKMRQRYDEWRRRVKEIQEQLAALEEKIRPGELESDQDRLLLFQEKKQLLLEYRSITPKSRSPTEMRRIQSVCRQLEADLNMAYEESNQCIANRLKLHEEKQALLQQLLEALKEFTHLEHQLKSLSASTLSISSSSSLGSLSTASSKGSLSGLSFTDIYGDPLSTEPQIDMVDMNRRVQRLFHPSSEVSSLSPRSSLSTEATPLAASMKLDWVTAVAAGAMSVGSNQGHAASTSSAVHAAIAAAKLVSTGAGPSYATPASVSAGTAAAAPSYAVATATTSTNTASASTDYNLDRQRLEEQLQELKIRQLGIAGGPLSPIYEKPPYLEPAALLSRSSSTSNTRSVSTTVSDESVAGDSGVFEASRAPPALLTRECAQVQIGLRYLTADTALCITIERGSNLGALGPPAGCQLFIRAMLLPGTGSNGAGGPGSVRTGTVTDWVRPLFKTMLVVPLPLDKVYAKTLHVKVMVLVGQREDWIGSTQISLAEFNPADATTSRWYNIVSRKSMNESELLEGCVGGAAIREESSDESTIISSQTSTLTRNQGQDELQAVLEMVYDELSNDDDDEEDEDDDEDDEEVEDDDEEEEEVEDDALVQGGGVDCKPASVVCRRRSNKHLQRIVHSVEEEDEGEEQPDLHEEGCASAEATELMIQEYMNSVKEQCGGDGGDDGGDADGY